MKHTIVMIHGISDGDGPYDFDALWKGLKKNYEKLHQKPFDDYFEMAPIKWDVATNIGETSIFQAAFGDVRPSDKNLVHGNAIEAGAALINTRAWRYFSTFLAGDIIAYIDESDNKIRETVWTLIRDYLTHPDGGVRKYSLIGHSLGSVIAYDFIFSLMVRNAIYDFATKPALTEEQIRSWQSAFTNLYTMGSPIGLFMMRRRDLWQNDFGELINPVDKSTTSRIWLNMWDKEDLVAYPLERIFGSKPDKALSDIEVDTGFMMPWAHTQYWSDNETAIAISRTLPPPQQIRQ